MLEPAQVATRSVSDLTQVRLIADNTDLDCAERMALIARIVAGWDSATANSTGRSIAEQVTLDRHYRSLRRQYA